jgi:hypothetical protein
MPLSNNGWELLIRRQLTQTNASTGAVRTVGTYQVYHDGAAVEALSGTTAESPGPSENEWPATSMDPRRVRSGRYPLATQAGTHYVTFGYEATDDVSAWPKPGIELLFTGARREILIHPGRNEFLSSIGCINLCTRLPDAGEPISYPGSRGRVIALIEDMKQFLGDSFPELNGKRIPDAAVVIEGDP